GRPNGGVGSRPIRTRRPPYPSSRKVLAATPPAIPEPRITMESSDVSRPDMNVRRLETGARCLSAADVNHGNWRWHEDHTTVRGIRRSEPNGSVALHGHCSCARAGSGFAADALDICRGRSVRGRRSKPLAFACWRTVYELLTRLGMGLRPLTSSGEYQVGL